MDSSTFLYLLAGLVLLVAGAEALVRGATALAAKVGISPLVIGLTVVAYGTSAPELAVSLQAALAGQADIALGNVVGSNIFNVLLILGAAAVAAPLTVARQLIRLDVWVMIGVSAALLLMALDLRVSRGEGAVLVMGAIAYTIWLIRLSRRENTGVAEAPEAAPKSHSLGLSLILVAVGLGMLVLGARWLVEAAVMMARVAGVSELVIGLTIVAGGTSLPEAATSILASLRGERDIAVGNVVGSNVFNILAVLGGSATISPTGVDISASALEFDIPVMVAVAVACLPVFFTGYRIDRWEGFLFLGYYVAYAVYLVLDATRSSALEYYHAGMVWFVLPLTAVTLGVVTVRSFRRNGEPA